MIKVTHEKIETVTEEFGLIELGGRLVGHQLYLRVPVDIEQEHVAYLQTRANNFLSRWLAEHVGYRLDPTLLGDVL